MRRKICLIDYDMSVCGGVEQVTAVLAKELSSFYEVTVLSICSQGELAYDLGENVKYRVLLQQEGRLREMQRALSPVLKAFFREHQIDVALIQGNYPGFLVAPLRFHTKTKLIFCDHGALMNQWDQKDIVLIRFLASWMCHRVVTLTEQSRVAYQKKFGLPGKKVRCIYNWIDLDRVTDGTYRETSKKILSAGRFSKEKGFDLLVQAFGMVHEKHPDWILDLYGDGEMMPQIRGLVSQLGLESCIDLMGMRPDLMTRYGDYAMYVMSSHREGMPLVLLEAKANRLPIVSFDIQTGPREIVRDGVDGILAPPENVEKLAEAMCALIESQEMRVQMSKRSQENLDVFSKKTILRQWIGLLEELMPEKSLW